MTRFPIALGVVVLTAVQPLAGQQPQIPGTGPTSLRRDDLHALIGRLDRAAQSPAYSEIFRARARSEAVQARTRLEEGDFQVGDRILLAVQGEEALSDTFTVGSGRVLQLPQVGAVPLQGVLHTELESYLANRLAQFLRDPKIQARSTMRVAIDGAVARPGFYSVPSEALLGEVLMAAGGPAPTALVERVRVERAGREVLLGNAVNAGTVAGRTLDQLDVRAGDRIVVPEKGGGFRSAEVTVRVVTYLLSLPVAAFAVTRLF